MKLSTVTLFKNIDINNDRFIKLDDKTLRKYQLHLLTIMQDIISVCEEHGFYYALSGGSVLGAIRHQGFIPWDDDMDIFLLGSERDRFLEVFKEKFGKKYWVHSSRTDNYGLPIGRIRQKGTILRGREDEGFDEAGFFIDIFWIENTFDKKWLRQVHGFSCLAVGLLLSSRNFFKNRKLMLEVMTVNKQVRLIFAVKLFIGFLISFMSVRSWAILVERVYSLSKNNNSKYITVPSGRKHYFGEMFLREDMVDVTQAYFENYKWNVPKNFETYLQTMYGDWTEIPDEEDRERHLILEIRFPNDENELI